MSEDTPQRALPAFATPGSLVLLDLETVPGDEQLCATTLQGLANRSRPSIYLLRASEEGKLTWLREFSVSHRPCASLAELLVAYRGLIEGMIIYDSDLLDSINVAVTLAGLEQSIVVSPRLAEICANAPLSIPVRADLRNRFSSRLAAYQWQVTTLWPRCTGSMLVGADPARGQPLTPYGGGLHDYALANRAMVVWLDPNRAPERALLKTILRDLPPYTPYLGWFPGDVSGEFGGVQLTSTYGVYVLAADHFANMTVFSGLPATSPLRHVTAPAQGQRGAGPENKIYSTFTMTEGDNLQYMQHRMRRLWDDPGRGRVPLNWTISPLVLDAAPALLDYYLRTRSANDLFIAGPSGAGYTTPNAWPSTTFGTFTQRSAASMRRLHLDIVWVLNRMNGRAMPLARAQAQAYREDIAPWGILLNYEDYTHTTVEHGDLPQAITQGVSSVSQIRKALAKAERRWNGRTPLFLSFGVLAWAMTPSEVAEVAQTLSPRQQIVQADDYFRLLRAVYR